MSGRQHRSTPLLDLGRVADAVSKAVRSAPRGKKPWGSLAPKVRRAMQPTKAERERFLEKYVTASCFDVRYAIRPIGNAFEVWDTASSAIVGTFETLRGARSFVEGRAS